ncbi:unnamed protein product [Colias eurytheme]|nr:unnamed protein product [Colias eurytheme]
MSGKVRRRRMAGDRRWRIRGESSVRSTPSTYSPPGRCSHQYVHWSDLRWRQRQFALRLLDLNCSLLSLV